MNGHALFTKRWAFILFLGVATTVLLVCGYYGTLSTSIHGYVYRNYIPAKFYEPSNQPDDVLLNRRNVTSIVYRFNNGRIRIKNSQYLLNQSSLASLSAAELEELYENVLLELTADCSTARRFGRREDGGWDLCLVGPFTPQQPCFSFSFGVNHIWEFDEDVASQFQCQVVTFDPSMPLGSHMHSARVMFLQEGLHATKGTVNSWPMDSYLDYLKRFNAENLVIDILKMDIEHSEWPALETSIRDGSLRNVKQLLMETHVDKTATVQQYLRFFAVLRALHDLGFRLWHYNWNTYGNYASQHHSAMVRTCCHELYYVNINFLSGSQAARNPSGSRLDNFHSGKPIPTINKTQGYEKLEAIRRTDLRTLTAAQLESLYFTIIEQQQITCSESYRIGGSGDGGWDICFADPFDIRKSKPPCVAFSFGINHVWTYDDQLADTYKCKVYMFDPSMTTVSDHQRKATSWFYRTGLSSENKLESNGWKMRTLCTLIEEAGYAGKPVDILKIDIEHWEWASFEKAFQEGCLKQVRQLLFETHTSELVRQKSDYARLIRVWLGLFDLGFRTWKWHKNPMSLFYKSENTGVQRACCYEHYMINTNMMIPL